MIIETTYHIKQQTSAVAHLVTAANRFEQGDFYPARIYRMLVEYTGRAAEYPDMTKYITDDVATILNVLEGDVDTFLDNYRTYVKFCN